MEKSKLNWDYSNYFKIISPEKIRLDKADIYYRKKYNDIVNYLKKVLTDYEDTIIGDYKRYINPKGCILLNIYPGNDVEVYLKLLSNSYQLNLVELNYNEIIKNPKEFFNEFPEIVEKLLIKDSLKHDSTENLKQHADGSGNIKFLTDNFTLFIVNENNFPLYFLKDKYLFTRFLNYFEDSNFFINNKVILAWITSYNNEIIENHNRIYKIFDLFIKIPLLDKIEREELLRSFSERNPKIVFDINALIEKTLDWEVEDIHRLLDVGIFKHFLNAELNNSSNEITDILVDLIEQGEFIASCNLLDHLNAKEYNILNTKKEFINQIELQQKNYDQTYQKIVNNYIDNIRSEKISDFMLEQFYENAASKNYNELLIIIEKLSNNEVLEENDKFLIAKYPFLLNTKPKMAQIHLEKAKKRIDQIKRVFGEDN